MRVVSEERLAGGNVSEVVRVGGTVRRGAGPWTPAVHALLDHLAAVGFSGAPRAYGYDEAGREVLDYLPGEVAHYPLPGFARTDDSLCELGRLLRRFHDVTAGFVPPDGASWYFPVLEPNEVICHGDVAPYNCVFRDGRPVAFIDFDTAHPGPRVWDVAYAAFRFVPLMAPGSPDGSVSLGEQCRRLRLLCDAYGLETLDRRDLVRAARDRLLDLDEHIRSQAAGNEAFAAALAEGHTEIYRAAADHIRAHETELRAAALGEFR